MDLSNKEDRISEVMGEIIAKCWEDSDFKAELMANPVATIEKFTGTKMNLPEGKKLIVQDQSQDSEAVYFNIPVEPVLDELELSDEQLELVAGGSTPVASYFLVVGAGVAVGSYLFGD